jgi:glycosyltransferase involved in cell wall biosynthesis
MPSTDKITIAIDTRILPRTWGGVAHATMGLVKALGALDGPEVYYLVVEDQEQQDWLTPHLGANQRIVDRRQWLDERKNLRVAKTTPMLGFVKRVIRPGLLRAKNAIDRILDEPVASSGPRLHVSDGFFESLRCDVLHIPHQHFVLAAVPTIYTPHDLQHLHYPQFFTAGEIARRETVYPAGCHFAKIVIAGTKWIKTDIVRQYALSPDKVQVIPWASPTLAYQEPTAAEIADVRDRYGLHHPFAFYPAAVWPHKNHIRLLEAIAELRDRHGIVLRLVCTGSLADDYWLHHWPKVSARMKELNLESQVKCLGFVDEAHMRALYRLAEFLVLPSLFEADSCPIHEAWLEGVPVTCSNVTALPDQVRDAALLFDPLNIGDIGRALVRMSTDAELRTILVQRGYRRVRDFDWERTARAYRAVYRRVAGVPLSSDEVSLLAWDWMQTPEDVEERIGPGRRRPALEGLPLHTT